MPPDTLVRTKVVVNEEAVSAAHDLINLIRNEGVAIPDNLQCKLTLTTIGAMTVNFDMFMDAVQSSFSALYNVSESLFVKELQSLANNIVIQCEQKQALALLSKRLQKLICKQVTTAVTQSMGATECSYKNKNTLLAIVVRTFTAAVVQAFVQANDAIHAELPHIVDEFLRLYRRRVNTSKPPAYGRGAKRKCREQLESTHTQFESIKQEVQAAVLRNVQTTMQSVTHNLNESCLWRCVHKTETEKILLCVQQLMLQQTKIIQDRVLTSLKALCQAAIAHNVKSTLLPCV